MKQLDRQLVSQGLKKAAIAGAAVVTAALATYGTYKLAKYTKEKRDTDAYQRAEEYVKSRVFRIHDDTVFRDGTRRTEFRNKLGDIILDRGSNQNVVNTINSINQRNARIVTKGRQMYTDATNTRFDRGLNKIVNAGDAVKRTVSKLKKRR